MSAMPLGGPASRTVVDTAPVVVSRNATPSGVASATEPVPASAIATTSPSSARPTSDADAASRTMAVSSPVAGARGRGEVTATTVPPSGVTSRNSIWPSSCPKSAAPIEPASGAAPDWRARSSPVVSMVRISPEVVPTKTRCVTRSIARAWAPGTETAATNVRVARSYARTASPLTTQSRFPVIREDDALSSQRGSTTAAPTGTPRSLVAVVLSSPHATSPPAMAYFARCGWVHS